MKKKLAIIFGIPPLIILGLVMILKNLFELKKVIDTTKPSITILQNAILNFFSAEEILLVLGIYFSVFITFLFSEYYLLLKTKTTFPKKLYLTFPISLTLITVIIAEFFYGISIGFDYFHGWNGVGTIIIAIVLGGGTIIYGYIRLGLQHWLRAFFQKVMVKFFTFIYQKNTFLLASVWFILLSLIITPFLYIF